MIEEVSGQSMTTTNPLPAPSPASRTTAAIWLLAGVLCLIQVLDVLGTTFLIVALPAVQAEMGLSTGATELLAGVFALCFGALLVPGGKLADAFGARRVLIAGLVLFVIASLTGGLAPGPVPLFTGRALQGVSAALAVPAALSLLTSLFPQGPRRSRALGIWTAAGAAGGMAGFALGGLVTDGPGWRWIFLLNVPVTLVALVLVIRLAPASAQAGSQPVALHRAALLAGGLLAVSIGLTRLRTSGDASELVWNGSILVIGLALLAAFARGERTARHPLIPRHLRRLPSLVGAAAVAGGLTFTTTSAAVILTQYLQHIHQLSPTQAGLFLAPGNVAIVIGSLAGSRLMTVRGFGPTMIAGLVAIGGAMGLCVLGLRTDALGWIAGGLVVNGLGLGAGSVASTACGLSQIREQDRGTASGLITTAAMLGTAIGIATLGGIAELWSRLQAGGALISDGDLTGGYAVALSAAGFLVLVLTPVARRADKAPDQRSRRP